MGAFPALSGTSSAPWPLSCLGQRRAFSQTRKLLLFSSLNTGYGWNLLFHLYLARGSWVITMRNGVISHFCYYLLAVLGRTQAGLLTPWALPWSGKGRGGGGSSVSFPWAPFVRPLHPRGLSWCCWCWWPGFRGRGRGLHLGRVCVSLGGLLLLQLGESSFLLEANWCGRISQIPPMGKAWVSFFHVELTCAVDIESNAKTVLKNNYM